MNLTDARDFIDRLYESSDGLTDEMRADLAALHDSADEQEGSENYWKEMSDKIDTLSGDFKDFKRDYVTRILSGNEALRKHEEDLKNGDFEDKPDEFESIFKTEVIDR